MKPQDQTPDLLTGAQNQDGPQSDGAAATDTATAADGGPGSEGGPGPDTIVAADPKPAPKGRGGKAKGSADSHVQVASVRLVMQTSLLSDVRGEQVARDRHAMASEALARQLIAAGRARLAAEGEVDPLGRPVLNLD